MEPWFRRDFSAVRVHSDATAAASTHDLGAAAYTIGQHIVFGANRYRPETPAGERLLAHELTHVVQDAVADSDRLPLVSDPEDCAERQADAVASRFGRCDWAPPVSGRPAALIQRTPETWFRGEATGVVPIKPEGALHDFGDGLYLTDSPDVAGQYAMTRAGDKPLTARRLSVAIEPERLGRVLDLTQDIRWQTYLKSRASPVSPTMEELIRWGPENYSRLFDDFVRINKIPIQEYDTIKGPELLRGGTQICIRNRAIQAEVRAALTDLPMSTSVGGASEAASVSAAGRRAGAATSETTAESAAETAAPASAVSPGGSQTTAPVEEPVIPGPAVSRAGTIVTIVVTLAMDLVLHHLSSELAEIERENIRRGWRVAVVPDVEKAIESLHRGWRENPETRPTEQTYLVVVYGISFEEQPHSKWILGGPVYLYQETRYLSSHISTTPLNERLQPPPHPPNSRVSWTSQPARSSRYRSRSGRSGRSPRVARATARQCTRPLSSTSAPVSARTR
jgi:Domain of unknown function (DUF4157)